MSRQTNTPKDSDESVEKVKKPKKYNLPSLRKLAIQREFRVPMQPDIFDAHKSNLNTLRDRIIAHMKHIRDEDRDDWVDVTDDQIADEATKEVIQDEIARYSQNLVLRRKRVMQEVRELAPSLSGDQYDEFYDEYVSKLNENQLHNLVMRNVPLRRKLNEHFPELNLPSAQRLNFESIFHDRNTYLTSESDRSRFQQIHEDVYRHHNTPDSDDVRFILGAYAGAPDSRKKEILARMGVKLPLRVAVNLGLVDDTYIEHLATHEFGDAYTTLSDEARESFRASLKNNTTPLVAMTDVTDGDIGRIFANSSQKRKLFEEIYNTLDIDQEKETEDALADEESVLSALKAKRAKNNLDEDENEDFDTYNEFVDFLKDKKDLNIKNVEALKTDKPVIEFVHENGSKQYIQILGTKNPDGTPIDAGTEGETSGIEIQIFNTIDRKVTNGEITLVTYDDFYRFLKIHAANGLSALTEKDFGDMTTKDPDNNDPDLLIDARDVDETITDASTIKSKLDMIDPKGAQYGFEKGTAFIAPVLYEGGKKSEETVTTGVWVVDKVHGHMVDLLDPTGRKVQPSISLESVYQTLKTNPGSYYRVAHIPNDEQMIRELTRFKIGDDAKLDGGTIMRDAVETDEHGHHHKKTISVETFVSEKGGHIRVLHIGGGRVEFLEHVGSTDLATLRAHAKKKGLKSLKREYQKRSMNYSEFLKFLERNNLNATQDDHILPQIEDHHHDHEPHLHGSFKSRVMKWQSWASISKGFEMLWHSIEHNFEKGTKLDAARFQLRMAKLLPLGDGVEAQAFADVVGGTREIIEKYKKKLFDLPGPKGRGKVIHYLQNKDARPEEVMGAMAFMLESYGHLYAEDLKKYRTTIRNQDHFLKAPRGTFMYFDALVTTTGLPNLYHWRAEAYKKAISEIGTEADHDAEPSEEQLIHGLFKCMEAAHDKHRVQSSVFKAFGGPGAFEKLFKRGGLTEPIKSGKESAQMLSAQGRLNRALGLLENNELYKSIGAMEAVVDLDKSPRMQAFPFAWCSAGISQYLPQDALKVVNGYAYSYSFHAYSFMKSRKENDMYRNVVRLALMRKGGPKLVSEYDKLCNQANYNPHDKEQPKYVKGLVDFWQRHCDGPDGLHNMLQGQNGWLITEYSKGNTDVIAYLDNFERKQGGPLGYEGSARTDLMKEWQGEGGLVSSRIFGWQTDEYNTKLLSLQRTLNKINFAGVSRGDRLMEDSDYDLAWSGVKEQMSNIRDPNFFDKNEKLQARQFLAYRRELITFFSQRLNTRSGKKFTPEEAQRYIEDTGHRYWGDLRKMGIDPVSIFISDYDKESEQLDYQRWKRGERVKMPDETIVDATYFRRKEVSRIMDTSPKPPYMRRDKDADRYEGFEDETFHGGTEGSTTT